MKKILIALTLITIAFSLSATETRLAGMGGVGMYMRDDSSVLLFPGLIRDFAGMAKAELRARGNDYDNYTVMAIMPVKNAAFGLTLNQPLNIYYPAGYFPELDLSHGTVLMYGFESGGMRIGFEGVMLMDSWSEETEGEIDGDEIDIEDTSSAFVLGLGAGVSNDMYDLGLTFFLPSAKNENEEIEDEDLISYEDKWGGMEIGFQGRAFYNYDQFRIIPLCVFNYGGSTYEEEHIYSYGSDDVKKTDDTKYSNMEIGVGVGVEYLMNENNTFILGVEAFGLDSEKREENYWEYSYTQEKFIERTNKYTSRDMILPGLYAGIESRITSWLTGRFGAAQVYRTETSIYDPYNGYDTTETTMSKDFDVTFGLGVNLGQFSLDATLNEGLFFEGPNFISGSEEVMAYQLSLKYDFK